ncbi:hypothetical protein ACWDSF_30030 [Nocardia beijingensis]|uniref:hypothetical protein n=1 Tax=Nocardia beijingensis TaxID=95162 RepID=UPI001895D32B|nr:hypothetical protein [Nocardia beijingensis]MBF6079067.1 hypothetical protein [Nocardia beijingensis]
MSPELAVELRRLEREGRTGVLRAGDGAFHLAEGAIVSADCRRTTGLDRLVVEAGVATAEDWRRADAGDPGRVLGRPRLETLAMLSVFDAAYFLLASPAVPEFRPAPPHWLAPVCHITPRALVQECARRGDPGSGPWPADLVDRVPVVPVRRVRRRRLVLTGGQAEVLAAVDGRRSVAGIGRELGRTTYGCLVAVRDLTAAGLIEPPVAARVSVAAGPVAPEPVRSGPPAVPPVLAEPGRLPRRRGRHSAPTAPVTDPLEPPDRDLLVRLQAALEELA